MCCTENLNIKFNPLDSNHIEQVLDMMCKTIRKSE